MQTKTELSIRKREQRCRSLSSELCLDNDIQKSCKSSLERSGGKWVMLSAVHLALTPCCWLGHANCVPVKQLWVRSPHATSSGLFASMNLCASKYVSLCVLGLKFFRAGHDLPNCTSLTWCESKSKAALQRRARETAVVTIKPRC